jgi:hypothetical protein
MKNVVFWDIKTQFVPHRRHITSPLQSPVGECYLKFEVSRRWLWRMPSSGTYWNRVRTSQEIHYVYTTKSSRLMLCKIWGFHGCDYYKFRLLGCYAVWLLLGQTVRRNVSPPSWVTRICEIGITLALTSNQSTLRRNTIKLSPSWWRLYGPPKRRIL